ncbi:MAG TPA: JAB domain-containing protein [Caldilineae bacterium]|nr:JAB domain-containing protein [Caldilineae bacterium]
MIRDLPVSERPRERLKHYGAGALSTSELLAIILRVGVQGESVVQVANRLLAQYGGLAGLARASFADLCAERGVGEAKAAQLKAALELGRRLLVASPQDRPQVTSPADAANLVSLDMSVLEQEEMRVLLLDTRNRVLAIETVYKGSLNSAVVRIGELFRGAIRANSAAIILVHNHPSGDPSPSPEDIRLTRDAIQAGKLLGIEVLDHLIIGQGKYVSLKERGLGF